MTISDEEHVQAKALADRLRAIADAEIAATGCHVFMGVPDRWWDTFLRRCTNDHVSSRTLKSEALGRDACLAGGCRAIVHITFPEDRDGPLEAPTWPG